MRAKCGLPGVPGPALTLLGRRLLQRNCCRNYIPAAESELRVAPELIHSIAPDNYTRFVRQKRDVVVLPKNGQDLVIAGAFVNSQADLKRQLAARIVQTHPH